MQWQMRGVGWDAGSVEKRISPLGGKSAAFGRNDDLWEMRFGMGCDEARGRGRNRRLRQERDGWVSS